MATVRWPSIGSRALGVCAVMAGALCSPANLNGQAVKSAVDPRVELMSIIFRLAGAGEYSRCNVPKYCQAIDSHFAPFRDHEVIRIVRRIRREDHVAYLAVMSMALHVKDVESLAERTPLGQPDSDLDERWKPAKIRHFLEAARRFAADTQFSEFVKSQQPLYDAAEASLRGQLNNWIDVPWLDRYFGAREIKRIVIIPAMTCGGVSFALTATADDGVRESYAILGMAEVDSIGQPRVGEGLMVDMVHEFIHSYISDPFTKFEKPLEKPGNRIFDAVRRRMTAQSYGSWGLVIVESLVRACTARYLAAHLGPEAGRNRVAYETTHNFLWLGELNDVLEQYEREREKYPTFVAFMPRVVEYFNQLAPRVAEMAARPNP